MVGRRRRSSGFGRGLTLVVALLATTGWRPARGDRTREERRVSPSSPRAIVKAALVEGSRLDLSLTRAMALEAPDAPRGSQPAWKPLLSGSYLVIETLTVNLVACATLSRLGASGRPASVSDAIRRKARTASAFAVATSIGHILHQRDVSRRIATPVWVLTHLLASASTLPQVLDGRQRPSDALVGAALGSAFGVLVPLLHRRSRRPDSDDLWTRLRIRPAQYDAGVGIKAQLAFY